MFVAVFDKVRPGVLIVGLNSVEESLQRDVVVHQRLLIRNDLILLDVSAKAQYIGNAGHCAQL